MRTARDYSVPPMLLYDGTPGWDNRSRTLAVALTILEDETGRHGHPLAEELDPNSNGWYQAEVVINEATAEYERFMKNAKDLEPGSMVVIRDTRHSLPAAGAAADEIADEESESDQ